MNKSDAVIIPGTINCQCIGVPSKQDLKPSITPTNGFNEYKKRYVSGIDEAEYTMGAVYINILMMNGMACFTSRNRIAMPDSHNPTPAEMLIITKTNSGKSKRFQVGTILKYKDTAKIKTIEIPKSTNFAKMGVIGKINRGK